MSRSDPNHVPEGTDVEVSPVARPASQAAPARSESQQTLASLAERANDAHKRLQRRTGEGLAHAIEAGTALREVKQRVPAGQWLPWLSANVEFSARTAQLYMKLAQESRSADVQRIVDLSLRAAAKAISTPRTHTRKQTQATVTVPNSPPVTAPTQNSPGATAPTQDSPPTIAAVRSLPPAAATQTGRRAPARREAGARKLDVDNLSRVRSVISAIDPLLARAQNSELSAQATAELLREAATAARAVSDRLNELAQELER